MSDGSASRAPPPLYIEFTNDLQVDPACPEHKFLIEYTFDGENDHIKAHPILLEDVQKLADFLGIDQPNQANLFAQNRLYHEIHDHHILGNRTGSDADPRADQEILSWLLAHPQNLEAECEVFKQYGRNGMYPVGDWFRNVQQMSNHDALAAILSAYFIEHDIPLVGSGSNRAEAIIRETSNRLSEYVEKAVGYFLLWPRGFLTPKALDAIGITSESPAAARLRISIPAILDSQIRLMAIRITEQAKDNPESELFRRINAGAPWGVFPFRFLTRLISRLFLISEFNGLVDDTLVAAFGGIGAAFAYQDAFLKNISAKGNCLDLALSRLTGVTKEEVQRFFFGQQTKYFSSIIMHRNIRQAVQWMSGPLLSQRFKIKVAHLDVIKDEKGQPQEIVLLFSGVGRILKNNLSLIFKRQGANRGTLSWKRRARLALCSLSLPALKQ